MSDAQRYCLDRSLWLRLRPDDARWLVQLAAARLALWRGTADDPGLVRDLHQALESAARDRYGNPLTVWFLVNVLIPIVVRLVLQWRQGPQE